MVLARVITLRFDPTIGSFDDMPLREFLKDKEALSIREHFFTADDIPYLAVFITYRLSQVKRPVAAAEATQKGDRSWQTMLTDDEMPLLNALRDWRNERSKQDGLPPYTIASNYQFALMVKRQPRSLTQLGAIERFGKSRVAKYGREIVAILSPVKPNGHANDIANRSDESADGQPQP